MTTEETTTPVTTEPQAGDVANLKPPAGVPPTKSEPQAGDDNPTIRLDEAKKLRAEAANLRKRLEAYEQAEEDKKLLALSEVEKANALVEQTAKKFQQYQQETEAKIKNYLDQIVTAKVKEVARDKGIIDPDIAAMAIHSNLEFDEEGMPSNVEKALDTLIKNKPYLLASKPAEAETLATPAQTTPVARPPMTPAMNPGRSNIPTPGQAKPGQIQTWDDVYKRS